MKRYSAIFLGLICYATGYAQGLDRELFTVPLQYTILKASDAISIDGKASEADWGRAPWTEAFSDIKTGEQSAPEYSTRAKMLWDDQYLYVYAQFPETDIWASLTEHDASVFQDHALEIFMDPDGDGHQYIEFQINAFATVWDLIMPQPYRSGGKPVSDWDIKGLKKAIYLDGTPNVSDDKDRSWSIELAFPLKSIQLGQSTGPVVGDIWRMNLTRVQWTLDKREGSYVRTKDEKGRVLPPLYLAWSSPGIVNFHYPERWGYVQFGDTKVSNFLDPAQEQVKLSLWHCYYLQLQHKKTFGKYASSLENLKKAYPELNAVQLYTIKVTGSESRFLVESSSSTNISFSIDQTGRFLTR